MRRLALLVGLLCGLHANAAHADEWVFAARLDEKPIGTHRFTLAGPSDARTLTSEARFTVTFLGLTAYRYEHQATEHWRGDCLAAITAATDDDGKTRRVRLDAAALPDCVMSFAYWNPQVQTQTRLLNAQTGAIEPVQITRAGVGTLPVRGLPTAATRWRIARAAGAVDVWYATTGEWIGLDAVLAGGRRLSYRLE